MRTPENLFIKTSTCMSFLGKLYERQTHTTWTCMLRRVEKNSLNMMKICGEPDKNQVRSGPAVMESFYWPAEGTCCRQFPSGSDTIKYRVDVIMSMILE